MDRWSAITSAVKLEVLRTGGDYPVLTRNHHVCPAGQGSVRGDGLRSSPVATPRSSRIGATLDDQPVAVAPPALPWLQDHELPLEYWSSFGIK
jgi:hypothetical protein